MAGTITGLKVQKKNRDRVSVYLDERYAFGLPAIVAAGLRQGQALSDAEIDNLREQGAGETAYNRALDYLSYRPRSRTEVTVYLRKREVGDSHIEAILDRLEGAGFLDDEAFARFWIDNRERFRPRGPRALRYELRSKGINDSIIDQALSGLDGTASAYRAAEKKARQLGHLDEKTFRKKLVEYLARRGFDYDVARDVTERYWAEQTADD